MGILPDSGPISTFPYGDRDEITMEIPMTGETGFSLKAHSRKLGVKTIFTGKKYPDCELALLGYFPSPGGLRMAMVIEENLSPMSYSNYHVVGCNLKTGFRKE